MIPAPPLVAMIGVSKDHGGPCPLRIAAFNAGECDRRVIAGLDQASAETFFHLISGAALPDEGTVRIAGVDTREISTDTEWLLSLDRFGFMTHRAVLLESLPVAANLALPITLAVDPMPPDVRQQVTALAEEVRLPRDLLDRPVNAMRPIDRVRLHFGRALGPGPRLLLLEHPTEGLADDADRRAFGETLRAVGERRGIGWIALSNDDVFARASGALREEVQSTTGALVRRRRWWFWR